MFFNTVDNIRLAVVSCANLEAGYFNSYDAINERNDVDALLMLGDYIYEYESGGYSPNGNIDRTWEPQEEIVELNAYRMRYSSYHLDYALRKLHQNYPWICIWDDHETANDAFKDGAQNHSVGEGDWQVRKENGKQAFFETTDEKEFPNADVVDIDREINRHTAFGLGIHRCIGSNLARLELNVAVEVFLERFPDFEQDTKEEVKWSLGQVRGPRKLPLRILARS